MSKDTKAYTRKTLHLALALFFCLGFIPSGADAKVTCDGMRCNHDKASAFQHARIETSGNVSHGCCSGLPEDPCNLDTKDKKEPPTWMISCCRIEASRSPYFALAEIDTTDQDRFIKGSGQGFGSTNIIRLTPIYLQTLSLRC
jgi:hypothetical protein